MASSDSTTSSLKRCSRKEQCIHPDNKDGWLPRTPVYFYKDRRSLDGLQSPCRECHKAAANKWAADNREQTRAISKNWRDNNVERERASDQAWKRNNPNKHRAKIHRRKARERNLPATLTNDEWERCVHYFDGCCAYCGTQSGLWNKVALDHLIPLSSADCPGTVACNVLPCCMSCNASKRDRNAIAWLAFRFGDEQAKVTLKRITAYCAQLATSDSP
jgi:hypothetical protein